jgi:anti-sigma regulatory factor (Ser/Thr protein kinase)
VVLDARAPRPEPRLNLRIALAAAAGAALAYLAALYTDTLPPRGILVALVAAVPVSALVALVIVHSRARAEDDPRLRWVGAGLAVSFAGLLLQLIAFPLITEGGGPLSTSPDSVAALYIAFHVSLAGAALLAALSAPLRWLRPALLAGLAFTLALALDLVPLPDLIQGSGRFTWTLTVVELLVAAATLGCTLVWLRRVGRTPRLLHGWVGIALSLSAYDLILNAATTERFQPVWWASLSMRVATYTVLAIGGLVSVLRQLAQYEQWSETELGRREAQLQESLDRSEQLLEAATTTATTLQAALLPQRLATPDGIATAARYRAAGAYADIGGDWYDTVPLPSGGVALVIGDVEGHDLVAASLMGLVRAAVRSYALEGHAPSVVLERVNRFLATTGTERLVTMAYVEVYPDDRLLTVALAGHPAPLLLPDDGKGAALLDLEPGLVLGVASDGRWEERTLLLPPRTALLLYTDGLLEWRRGSGESMEALLEVAGRSAGSDVERLADALLAEAPRDDDVALLVTRLSAEQRAAVERRLPVQPMSLPIARGWLSDVVGVWGRAGQLPAGPSSDDLLDTAQLLLTELLSNALRHSETPILVAAALRDGRLRVDVTDSGHRMPKMREAGPGETAGRGLRLVDSLSAAWGVTPLEHGKRVWFEVDPAAQPVTGDADEEALLAAWGDDWDASAGDGRGAIA